MTNSETSHESSQEKEFAEVAIQLFEEWTTKLEELIGKARKVPLRQAASAIRGGEVICRRVSQSITHGMLYPADELKLAVKLIEFEALLDAAKSEIPADLPGFDSLIKIDHDDSSGRRY